MRQVPEDPQSRRPIGAASILRPQIIGDDRVDSDAKADGHRVDQILNRIDQGQGCHGVLTDFGHKIAVHDIVEGAHQHGENHGKRHGQHQAEYGFFFHKCIVHSKYLFCAGGSFPKILHVSLPTRKKKPHSRYAAVWRKAKSSVISEKSTPIRVLNYYSCGPADTSALPASLLSYFAKFLMKRPARSFALVSHSEASA